MRRSVVIACVVLSILSSATWGQATKAIPDPRQFQQAFEKHNRGEPLSDAERETIQRAIRLHAREAHGEKLSDEERQFLDRAKQGHRAAQLRQGGGNLAPANTRKIAATLVPLTEMTAEERYRGQDGGLYGHGQSQPPQEHLQRALAAAGQIQPRAADGRPAADGKIALLSVGMSNTTQEFSRFVQVANADPSKSPHLVIVDGAQGGQDSAAWARAEKAPRGNPWQVLDERLAHSGVTAPQVQVVWIKQARIRPSGIGEMPKHVDALKTDLAEIVARLEKKFPNLRLVYLSSRIYAGFATTALNPEPYAYESAFAVRQLIQEQIRAGAKGPVLLWGPYLWAGEKPRKADGLSYGRADLVGDGTHPSDSGREKVAQQLLRFFSTDPTSRPWFAR